jgi:GT2 family glycosyltransferase
MSDPLLIIPVYITSKEHGELLNTCVKSLRKTTDAPVMLIDDGSPFKEQVVILFDHFDKTYDNLEFVHKAENKGFSTTVNIGLAEALRHDQDAVLVNADIEFKDYDWLKNMQKTDADIVGARLLYPNTTIQHAGIYFSSIARGFDHRYQGAPHDLPEALVPCQCPVTGALQYLTHAVIEDIGIYDEEFRLGYEDVDYMIRAIQAGHKSIYNPSVVAIHHESAFRKGVHTEWQEESFMRLANKYKNTSFINIAPTMMEKTYAS